MQFTLQPIEGALSMRTSDRRSFRRCPRRWKLSSSFGDNYKSKGFEQNINFWFGSAIHYAMEDYHGDNYFGDPRKALYAYYKSFRENELPSLAKEWIGIGLQMLDYYMHWLPKHNRNLKFETLEITDDYFEWDGDPNVPHYKAVEISFYIPLGWVAYYANDTGKLVAYRTEEGYSHIFDLDYKGADAFIENCTGYSIYYHGTIDKIMKDQYGNIYLVDYKTAKKQDTEKLDTDDQIDAYLWAANKLFNFPVQGFSYIQLKKQVPNKPKYLKSGALSTDKKQNTTHYMYKHELLYLFEDEAFIPNKYIEFLNYLASQENDNGDQFIRWDFIHRTKEEIENTEKTIYKELQNMLHILGTDSAYASPTRDCSWDCNFKDICIAMNQDDKSTIDLHLEAYEMKPRDFNRNTDEWKANLDLSIKNMSIENIMEQFSNIDKEVTMEINDEEGSFIIYGLE